MKTFPLPFCFSLLQEKYETQFQQKFHHAARSHKSYNFLHTKLAKYPQIAKSGRHC